MYFHHSWANSFYATWLERARKRKKISGILVENVVILTPLCTSLGNFEFTHCWELMSFVLGYWLGFTGCRCSWWPPPIPHLWLMGNCCVRVHWNHEDVSLIGWRKREERWFTFSCPLSGISNCWQKTKENCLSHSKDLVRFEEHCTAGKLHYVILIIFSFQITILILQSWR